MMKLVFTFTLAYVLFVGPIRADHQDLSINLSETVILSSRNQYRIQLKPQGKYPPFRFQYKRVPENWLAQQKYIYAPIKQGTNFNLYLISVVLLDSRNNQFTFSIRFAEKSGQLILDKTIYDQTMDPTMLLAPKLDQTSLQKVDLNNQAQNVMIMGRNSIRSSPPRNILDIFERILKLSQIQEILVSNNIPALVRAVSYFPQRTLACIQKLAYLTKVIEIAQNVKQQRLKKQQILQQQALTKISQQTTNKITQQNPQTGQPPSQKKQDQQQKLKLQQRTKQLKQKYSQIIGQYKNQFKLQNQQYKNSLKDKLAVTQLNIKKQTQQKNLDQLITILKNMTLQKNQLAIFQKTHTLNQTRLDQRLKYLNQNQQKIRNVIKLHQLSISQIKQQIAEYQKNQDSSWQQQQSIKSSLLTIQLQIESIIKQISFNNYLLNNIYSKNTQEFNPEITRLIHQTSNPSQISSVLLQHRKDILLIQQAIQYVKGVYDDVHTQCYGRSSVNIGQLPIYEISFQDWSNNLRKYSQTNAISENINIKGKSKSLDLQGAIASIESNRLKDALPQSRIQQNNPKNKQQFLCKAPGQLGQYIGYVTKINTNLIQVRIKTQTYYVLVGACTTIHTVQPIRIGQVIFWRALQFQKGVYDAFFIVSFDYPL